jgi:amino acid permease
MGSGFLVVPWIFRLLGIVPSIIGLVVTSLLTGISALQFIEALSRTEVLNRMEQDGAMPAPLYTKNKGEPILTASSRYAEIEEYQRPELGSKELSLTHIMTLNFAPWVGKAFSIFVIISEVICIAAYCSIFAASFASNVPIGTYGTCSIYHEAGDLACWYRYWFYLAVFTII